MTKIVLKDLRNNIVITICGIGTIMGKKAFRVCYEDPEYTGYKVLAAISTDNIVDCNQSDLYAIWDAIVSEDKEALTYYYLRYSL